MTVINLHQFEASDANALEAFAGFARAQRQGDVFSLGVDVPGAGDRQHLFVLERGGAVRAQVGADPVTGFLGFFDALPDADPGEVARLLDAAAVYLAARGHRRVIGPINRSTWYAYRFTVPDGKRPFFLDSRHPAHYLSLWESAGFAPCARYLSTCVEPRPRRGGDRFATAQAQRGVRVEAVDPAGFEAALAEIHGLANQAFAANPFFCAIDLRRFMDLYRPIAAAVDPRWTLLARRGDGALDAFVFATPDFFDPDRRAVVIKTVASRTPGLGAWLVSQIHERARCAGKSVIHALMHEANASTRIEAGTARVVRRYLLLERRAWGAQR